MQTALVCVLLAGLLPYLFTSIAKATGKRYDNADTRSWQATLTGLPHRAHAAHLNGFEAFPLFAAAVIAALLADAAPERVSLLAIAFVVLRLVYGVVYLMDLATVRSLVWFAAFGCTIAIFVEAIRAAA